VASAMRWTTTAQLLCNTPTMIIEGFLLLVLIEAHCIADEVKGRHLRGVLERRLMLNRYLRDGMVEFEKGMSVVSDVESLNSSLTQVFSRTSSMYYDTRGTLKYPEDEKL